MLDMINVAYREKPLIFVGATFREKLVSHHQPAGNKAVSDTMLDMINAVYHDKPLIFLRAVNICLLVDLIKSKAVKFKLTCRIFPFPFLLTVL